MLFPLFITGNVRIYRICDLEINVLMVAAGIESPKLNGLEGQSKDQKLKLLNRYE